MGKRLYAVAYDIPDDTRRVKLANLLKSYGERVQLSVFECYLDERLLEAAEGQAAFGPGPGRLAHLPRGGPGGGSGRGAFAGAPGGPGAVRPRVHTSHGSWGGPFILGPCLGTA